MSDNFDFLADVAIYSLDCPPFPISIDGNSPRPQEIALDVPNNKKAIKLADIRCVGTWSTLPVEIKTEIFKYLLPSGQTIDVHCMIHGSFVPDLKQYGRVSTGFRSDVDQFILQNNEVLLRPGTSSDEQTLSLFYPRPKANHMIKHLEFCAYNSEAKFDADGNEHHWWGSDEQRMNDTWQFLKNITLGKYGFQTLDRIHVYFDPKPWKMQAFWNWEIKVKVGDRCEIIHTTEENWIENLEAVLKLRAAQWPMDSGFELVRRKEINTYIE